MLSITSLWALARVHPGDTDLRRAVGERLVAHLKDPDAMVRAAAAHALAALPPALKSWPRSGKRLSKTRMRNGRNGARRRGPVGGAGRAEAGPRLEVSEGALHVLSVLGKIGPAAAPATAAVTELIADKDDDVAYEALMTLAKIGPGPRQPCPN